VTLHLSNRKRLGHSLLHFFRGDVFSLRELEYVLLAVDDLQCSILKQNRVRGVRVGQKKSNLDFPAALGKTVNECRNFVVKTNS